MPPLMRILIVEDELILAENIKQYLGRHVTDVRVVNDGERAVEMLDAFMPDMIVMDYKLPGMNGLDTYCEMARRHAQRINCVMITGNPSEALHQCASECGIRSVLCKPFSLVELLASLEPVSPANDE